MRKNQLIRKVGEIGKRGDDMYLDKDAILNSLTKEDIIKIVMNLGSAYPKSDSNGDLIFQSVCHG